MKNECMLDVMLHFPGTDSKLKHGLNFWEAKYIALMYCLNLYYREITIHNIIDN